MELAKKWTRERKLASIPVSAFYIQGTDHKVLRFCFAKSDETLLKGAEILNAIE
jgi:methionine aminotransferase